MKKKFIVLMLPIIILVIPKISLSQTNEDPCYNEPMTNFAKKIESDLDSACLIAGKIFSLVDITQDNITRIADSKVEYERKTSANGIIENIIAVAFESKNSIIYITSLNNKKVLPRNIGDYLQSLANFSADGTYITVTLTFYKDYTKLLETQQIDNDTYLFKIETWQQFKGCKSDANDCYIDVTRKIFHAILTKKTSDPTIKIQEISALDTYTYDQFIGRQSTMFGAIK